LGAIDEPLADARGSVPRNDGEGVLPQTNHITRSETWPAPRVFGAHFACFLSFISPPESMPVSLVVVRAISSPLTVPLLEEVAALPPMSAFNPLELGGFGIDCPLERVLIDGAEVGLLFAECQYLRVVVSGAALHFAPRAGRGAAGGSLCARRVTPSECARGRRSRPEGAFSTAEPLVGRAA
jgi:hypothetical protein